MASTINATTFKLYEKGANISVKARVAYDANTKTARLNPTKELKPHTRYTAVVSVGAKLDFGHLRTKGVGCVRHQPAQRAALAKYCQACCWNNVGKKGRRDCC
jgi:hypothetical protein